MNDATLTIGQVAKHAGLNVSAIRYYEAEGLLPEPPRVSGQRRYGDDTLTRLGVIDVAKRAGFTLDDIRVLLSASDAGEPAHDQVQELAQRKLPEVEELIDRAQAVRSWLTTATRCGCQSLDVCALFANEARLPPEGLHLVVAGHDARGRTGRLTRSPPRLTKHRLEHIASTEPATAPQRQDGNDRTTAWPPPSSQAGATEEAEGDGKEVPGEGRRLARNAPQGKDVAGQGNAVPGSLGVEHDP